MSDTAPFAVGVEASDAEVVLIHDGPRPPTLPGDQTLALALLEARARS